MQRWWHSVSLRAAAVAIVMIGTAIATAPMVASASVFSFARKDYLLQSPSGLDSVAVGDLDGKNGPDIVVESLPAALGTVNVLLNNGDGTFAPAEHFDSCPEATNIIVGQFNPSTDDFLDVALICGSRGIGRMLGDGQGNLGAVQSLDVSTLSEAAAISFLRLGAMNGPTLVYAEYLAAVGQFTLCFLKLIDFEYDLDGGGANFPSCNVHYNDLVGNPDFGKLDDWGPIANDLAVGAVVPDPNDPLNRDEAVSGGSGFPEIPIAVTGYVTPFSQFVWGYGVRASGNTGTAVALADLDGDKQNDLLIGGSEIMTAAKGTISDYVPGSPIEQSAQPTHRFDSIPYLFDMVTADFNGDGKIDIAVLGDDDDNDEAITVGIHAGQGDGTFAPYEGFKTQGYVSNAGGEQMIAVADFDRNGSPDLVTVGRLEKSASVLLNGTAAGCSACPSATKQIGPAGGSLALPDGSVTVTVPPGAVAAPTNFVITSLPTSTFGVGTPQSLVKVVTLAPEGVIFSVPVELRFLWPDAAPENGFVDGLGVDEGTLRFYRNGLAITGQCRNVVYQPGSCTTACCDTAANTWTVKVSSFSEYVLDAASCATFAKPKLTLGKILAPTGDDTFAFAGSMPAPATAPDPDLAGLTILLDDANGAVLNVTLPAGAFDKATKIGWKVDKKRTKWTWSHPKVGGPSGIVKAMIAVKKGVLTAGVKATAGDFIAAAPLRLTLTLPVNGACGETRFAAPGQSCAVKSKGKTLACK